MRKQQVIDAYPLSPMQSGMLFHHLYAPESDAYLVQSIFQLDGELELVSFISAWQTICNTSPIFRTGFGWKNSKVPFQYVLEKFEVPFEFKEWEWDQGEEKESTLEAFLKEDRKKHFDLSNPPLFRLTLIRLTSSEHLLIWSQHHILLDGWCVPIVLHDVLEAYQVIVQCKIPYIPSRRPFRDYIAWLKNQNMAEAKQFWKRILHGVEGSKTLSFKGVFQRETEKDYDNYLYTMPENLTEQLKYFAQKNNLTLNTLLQAALGIVLKAYIQNNEVILGVTVSGRNIELSGIEEMLGLFINTLPLRISIDSKENLLSFLHDLQITTQKINNFNFISLAEIQSWVGLNQKLFEVLFIFENYPSRENEEENTSLLRIKSIKGVEKTEFPLTIAVGFDKQLHFNINYQTEHFSKALIRNFLEHIKYVLVGISQASRETTISELSLLSTYDKHQLIIECNKTKVPYPVDKTVHQIFEEQVEKTPHHIAVSSMEQTLSYQMLNERSNQLSNYLKTQSIGPNTIVAVSITRSLEMIITLLAILKTGAAYVPLDPSYPIDRLHFMLEDTKAAMLITQEHIKNHFKDFSEKALCVKIDVKTMNLEIKSPNRLQWINLKNQSSKNPYLNSRAGDVAFVIYTSGSTGNPKAVLIPHRAMINRFSWMWNRYPFTEEEVACHKTSLNFVDAIWEIFGPLLKGVKLLLIPEDTTKDPEKFFEFLKNGCVTRLLLVPSFLESLLYTAKSSNANFKTLKICTVSGEILSSTLSQKFKDTNQNTLLLNLYGSTEIGADATFYEVSHGKSNEILPEKIPIGRAINNLQIYILDSNLEPVPVGVSGEIYAGGSGLALGYLNHPDLTAEQFIPNLFASTIASSFEPNLRLYRTGDFARYLSDGNIEFLGRIDNQIKINGRRIELNEIEANLGNHPNIFQVVVTAQKNDNMQMLTAYIILDKSIKTSLEPIEFPGTSQKCSILTGESLVGLTQIFKKHLAQTVPDYMIPTHFLYLDKIPLTPNGKLNKMALPIPNLSLRTSEAGFVAPISPLQQSLASIWSEILKVEKIGIHDNLFKIGGHSLLAMQLISRINLEINKEIRIVELFNHPNIDLLSKYIELMESHKLTSPLFPIQTAEQQPILFLIHPAGGLGFNYIKLAQKIKDIQMYGINNPHYDKLEANYQNIEEMAADYIKTIRTVQKQGPYLLGGWSLGGLIAYEMAQQLNSNNEVVSCVIMIDTTMPAYFSDQEKCRSNEQKISLRQANDKKIAHHDLEYLMELNAEDAKMKILQYEPKPYLGKVALIKADINEYGYLPNSADYGWGSLVRDFLIINTTGRHDLLFDNEYVSNTAQSLEHTLTQLFDKTEPFCINEMLKNEEYVDLD